MFEVRDRREEANDFVRTEHDRQGLRPFRQG